MNFINDNKVNTINEYNLLHGILNISKYTKNKHIHYSPIVHVCMNICRGKDRLNSFWILLYSRYSSNIVVRRIITKLKT